MKIQSLKVHNFKGIKNYQGEIKGKNVYLIGGNGVGKTSFIDAIWYGLKGKMKIPEITHNGAKKGLIEIDLGDFIARTKLKKDRRAEFELENKVYNDETDRFIKSPRSYLENRIGVIDFDIMSFLNMTGLEQVKYFSKCMGVDFSDLDADIEENEESRKFDKRSLSDAKKNVNYYNEEDAEKEYVSVVELSKQIDAETAIRNNREKVQEGIKEREASIDSLNDQITALIAERVKKENEIISGNKWLEDNPEMTEENFQELKTSRDNAELTNETIREAKDAKQADELVEKYEKSIEEYNETIEKLRQKKAARISDNLNVENLTYDIDKECFLYNGLPLDKNQTNTASMLIVGMKMAASLLKDLKILKVDASLIDSREFEKVANWAESEGIELFIELVDRDATQLTVVVDDGETI